MERKKAADCYVKVILANSRKLMTIDQEKLSSSSSVDSISVV